MAGVLDEAIRRDPDHRRTWVALVDGNNHQIDRIQAEASTRGVDLSIVIEFSRRRTEDNMLAVALEGHGPLIPWRSPRNVAGDSGPAS